jgi:hypothetical protein
MISNSRLNNWFLSKINYKLNILYLKIAQMTIDTIFMEFKIEIFCGNYDLQREIKAQEMTETK